MIVVVQLKFRGLLESFRIFSYHVFIVHGFLVIFSPRVFFCCFAVLWLAKVFLGVASAIVHMGGPILDPPKSSKWLISRHHDFTKRQMVIIAPDAGFLGIGTFYPTDTPAAGCHSEQRLWGRFRTLKTGGLCLVGCFLWSLVLVLWKLLHAYLSLVFRDLHTLKATKGNKKDWLKSLEQKIMIVVY